MRAVCLLFLAVFAGAVGLFAFQNNRVETITLWDRQWELSFPLVVGGAYLLGMLSGWTVVGLLRRSVYRVTEGHHHPQRLAV